MPGNQAANDTRYSDTSRYSSYGELFTDEVLEGMETHELNKIVSHLRRYFLHFAGSHIGPLLVSQETIDRMSRAEMIEVIKGMRDAASGQDALFRYWQRGQRNPSTTGARRFLDAIRD